MRPFRGVGGLLAAAAGGAAGVGVAVQTGSAVAAGGATALVALALGYAVGSRSWLPFVSALAYVGVGVAVLAGDVATTMITLQVAAAYLGVGGAVCLLFLVRWRAGNLKRLSTRPVDAGRLRLAVASVARTVKAGRSLVRRLAGVRPASVPLGAFVLVALWVGIGTAAVVLGRLLVAGELGVDALLSAETLGLARPVSAVLAPVTLVPYLAALLVPAYLATDWYGLDGITDPPDTYGVLARAAGRTPPSLEDRRTTPAPTDPDPTPDDPARDTPQSVTDPTPAADDSATPTADADAGVSPDPTDDPAPEHWPNTEDNPWTDRPGADPPPEDPDPDAGTDPAPATTDTSDPSVVPPDADRPAGPTAAPADADDAGETAEPEPAPEPAGDRVTFGEPLDGDTPADTPTVTGDGGDATAMPGDTLDAAQSPDGADDADPTPAPADGATAGRGEDPAESESAEPAGADGGAPDDAGDETLGPDLAAGDDGLSDPTTWTTPPAAEDADTALDTDPVTEASATDDAETGDGLGSLDPDGRTDVDTGKVADRVSRILDGEADPGQTDTDLDGDDGDPEQVETGLGSDADEAESDADEGGIDPDETDADAGQTDSDPDETESDTDETDTGQTDTDPDEAESDPGQTDTDPDEAESDPGQTDADIDDAEDDRPTDADIDDAEDDRPTDADADD